MRYTCRHRKHAVRYHLGADHERRGAGDPAERRRAEIEAALDQAISAYLIDEGIVMDSSSWVITARNPG